MNTEQKAQRYDWLLGQHKRIEDEIQRIPKLPLEETLSSLDSREYTSQNLSLVNALKSDLHRINEEVKTLF